MVIPHRSYSKGRGLCWGEAAYVKIEDRFQWPESREWRGRWWEVWLQCRERNQPTWGFRATPRHFTFILRVESHWKAVNRGKIEMLCLLVGSGSQKGSQVGEEWPLSPDLRWWHHDKDGDSGVERKGWIQEMWAPWIPGKKSQGHTVI